MEESNECNDFLIPNSFNTFTNVDIVASKTEISNISTNINNAQDPLIASQPNSDEELFNLLKNWQLENLYSLFLSEEITVEVLRIIKPHHIQLLMKNFNLGTLIRFEHKLEQWREHFDETLVLDNRPSSSKRCSMSPALCSLESVDYLHSPTTSPSSNEIYLSKILNNTNKGIMLCKSYEEHNHFDEKERIMLIGTIVQYFENSSQQLSLKTSYRLEAEILERFPSEKLEFYRTSKRGRIYNKAANMKMACRTSRSTSRESTPTSRISLQFVPEVGAEAIRRSLQHDHLSSQNFDRAWKACSQFRLNEIKEANSIDEIFEKWPEYKKPSAYRLIDMDFSLCFPEATSILQKWDVIEELLLNLLSKQMQNKHIKAELMKIKSTSSLTKDNRSAIILWALHGYLIPCHRTIKKDQGKKIIQRYSVADSQDSFILLATDVAEAEEKINQKIIKCERIQPFIICIGTDVSNITKICIFFDNVKFAADTFIRAVDVCFKIFYLFNLEYPNESKTFWNFIQNYFFSIKSSEMYSKVNILINEIEKSQNGYRNLNK